MRAWLSTVQVPASSETVKNFEFCTGRKLFWTGCVTICLSLSLHIDDKMPELQHFKRDSNLSANFQVLVYTKRFNVSCQFRKMFKYSAVWKQNTQEINKTFFF
jgi:hypothetical protein